MNKLIIAIILLTGCSETAYYKTLNYKYTIYASDLKANYTNDFKIKNGVISFTSISGVKYQSNVWTIRINNEELLQTKTN